MPALGKGMFIFTDYWLPTDENPLHTSPLFELKELEVCSEEISPGLNGWLDNSKNLSIPLTPNIPASKSDNFHAERFR